MINYNLQFFADKDDKTEQPTAKKKNDARGEGQVAKSQEIGTAFLFLAAFYALKYLAPFMLERLLKLFYFNFTFFVEATEYSTTKNMSNYVNTMFGELLIIMAPMFAIAMIVGIIANVAQVGWHPTTKPLKPKFSRLNPISGFKRLFSLKVLVDLVKNLAKLAIIIYAIYATIIEKIDLIPVLIHMELFEIVTFLGELVVDMGIDVGMYFLFVAAADYAYNKFKHNKDIKMSKQEVKDEYKNSEGDPQIKGKIKQRMREAAMRRMMNDVPQADVIITNPTHYAVAVKYDKNKSEAPYVVAKGTDHLARRIKEIAAENRVEIVENKPLARTLYATVDIGKEIPPELYQAVAEILAFVYKLKNVV